MSDLRKAAERTLRWLDSETPTTVDAAYAEERAIAEALRAALARPDIDPVDEYRKGFIDGQIDMRDRPEEPVQHYASIPGTNVRVRLQPEPVQDHVPGVRKMAQEPVATLTAQRDALLEALKGIVAMWDHHCYAHGDGQPTPLHAKARAAIKMVEERRVR